MNIVCYCNPGEILHIQINGEENVLCSWLSMSGKVLEQCLFCLLYPTRELTEEALFLSPYYCGIVLWRVSAGCQAEHGS